ncbi:MAG TPA: phosphate ABC transporter, permease protein PstA, partial [Rhodothermales bacterium]
MSTTDPEFRERIARRNMRGVVLASLFFLSTVIGVVVLVTLLVDVVVSGGPWLDWEFLSNYPSRFAERAGIKSAIVGSLYVIGLTAVLAVPIGV